jgi:hypothetical protein
VIGAELLNLMYGNPYNQLAGAMNPNPAPNPNPNAPPQQLRNIPGATGPTPGTGYIAPAPHPIGPDGRPLPGVVTPATPAEQRGAQVGPSPPPTQQGLPPTAATQSPPDLASLYLQMEQRNRSANEIDHGLDMIAAAYSTPQMASAIMGSQRQGQDPGAQLGNLIQLQNMQRQSLNRPNIIAALTGGGAVDPNLAAAYNGMSNDQLQTALNDKMRAQIALQQKQAESGIAVTQAGAEEKQKDLLEAQDKAPGALQQMNDMDNVANQLKGPMAPALQSIISSSTKRTAAEKLLETDPAKEPWDVTKNYVYANMLSSDELAALQQLKKLDAQIYGDAFQSTGSRRTQQEVANLKSGVSTLLNFNQSPDAYMSQFNDFQNNLHKTMANTYGAAGRVDEIPDSIKWDMSNPNAPKPLVDSAYLPNGNKYAGQGGQWAANPPKSNFDYASIPSGTVYTAPDGTQRRKP